MKCDHAVETAVRSAHSLLRDVFVAEIIIASRESEARDIIRDMAFDGIRHFLPADGTAYASITQQSIGVPWMVLAPSNAVSTTGEIDIVGNNDADFVHEIHVLDTSKVRRTARKRLVEPDSSVLRNPILGSSDTPGSYILGDKSSNAVYRFHVHKTVLERYMRILPEDVRESLRPGETVFSRSGTGSDVCTIAGAAESKGNMYILCNVSVGRDRVRSAGDTVTSVSNISVLITYDEDDRQITSLHRMNVDAGQTTNCFMMKDRFYLSGIFYTSEFVPFAYDSLFGLCAVNVHSGESELSMTSDSVQEHLRLDMSYFRPYGFSDGRNIYEIKTLSNNIRTTRDRKNFPLRGSCVDLTKKYPRVESSATESQSEKFKRINALYFPSRVWLGFARADGTVGILVFVQPENVSVAGGMKEVLQIYNGASLEFTKEYELENDTNESGTPIGYIRSESDGQNTMEILTKTRSGYFIDEYKIPE